MGTNREKGKGRREELKQKQREKPAINLPDSLRHGVAFFPSLTFVCLLFVSERFEPRFCVGTGERTIHQRKNECSSWRCCRCCC